MTLRLLYVCMPICNHAYGNSWLPLRRDRQAARRNLDGAISPPLPASIVSRTEQTPIVFSRRVLESVASYSIASLSFFQIHKKRRIVGRVRCKNIKSECPVPAGCDDPVLLPGRCCKVCPGQTNSEYIAPRHRKQNTSSLARRIAAECSQEILLADRFEELRSVFQFTFFRSSSLNSVRGRRAFSSLFEQGARSFSPPSSFSFPAVCLSLAAGKLTARRDHHSPRLFSEPENRRRRRTEKGYDRLGEYTQVSKTDWAENEAAS